MEWGGGGEGKTGPVADSMDKDKRLEINTKTHVYTLCMHMYKYMYILNHMTCNAQVTKSYLELIIF